MYKPNHTMKIIIPVILLSILSYIIYNYIESRRQFVFGYGSLIIDKSREKTLEHPSIGYKAYLSSTFKYKRSWTMIEPKNSIHLVMKHNHKQEDNTPGVIFQVNPESLARLDYRERMYQRIQVPVHMIQTNEIQFHNNNKIWIYVRNNNPIHPVVYSTTDHVKYINQLLDACHIYGGDDYAKNFIRTTSGWNLNWLEYRSIHESLLRYKNVMEM